MHAQACCQHAHGLQSDDDVVDSLSTIAPAWNAIHCVRVCGLMVSELIASELTASEHISSELLAALPRHAS